MHLHICSVFWPPIHRTRIARLRNELCVNNLKLLQHKKPHIYNSITHETQSLQKKQKVKVSRKRSLPNRTHSSKLYISSNRSRLPFTFSKFHILPTPLIYRAHLNAYSPNADETCHHSQNPPQPSHTPAWDNTDGYKN